MTVVVMQIRSDDESKSAADPGAGAEGRPHMLWEAEIIQPAASVVRCTCQCISWLLAGCNMTWGIHTQHLCKLQMPACRHQCLSTHCCCRHWLRSATFKQWLKRQLRPSTATSNRVKMLTRFQSLLLQTLVDIRLTATNCCCRLWLRSATWPFKQWLRRPLRPSMATSRRVSCDHCTSWTSRTKICRRLTSQRQQF